MLTVAEKYERGIKVIQDERAYQRRRWGIRQKDGSFITPERDLDDYLVPIYHYLNRATTESTKAQHLAALVSIRKIAALAAATLECYFGWPEKELWETIRTTIDDHPPPPLGINSFIMMAAAEIAKFAQKGQRSPHQGLMVVLGAISCFVRHAAPSRDPYKEVINWVDDQPA